MSFPPATPPALFPSSDLFPVQPSYESTLAVKKRLAVLHSKLALSVDAKGTRTPSVSPTTQPSADSDHSPHFYPSPGPYERALLLKQKELDGLRAENEALRIRVRELEMALSSAQSHRADSEVVPAVEVNKKGIAVCWTCWLCDEYLGSSAERVFHSKAFSHRLRAQKAQALRRKHRRMCSDNPFGYMKHYPNGVVSFKFVESDTGAGEWKIRNIHVTPDMKPPKALLESLWAKVDAA